MKVAKSRIDNIKTFLDKQTRPNPIPIIIWECTPLGDGREFTIYRDKEYIFTSHDDLRKQLRADYPNISGQIMIVEWI